MAEPKATVLMLLLKDVAPDVRVLREALSLARAGYEVWVAHLGQEGYSAPHPNLRLVGIRLVTRAKGRPRGRLPQVLKAVEFLYHVIALARRLRPRVIHAHDLPCLILGLLPSRLVHRCRLVYDAHELWPDMAGRKPLEARLGRVLERYAIRRAALVITVNRLSAQVMEAKYGRLNFVSLGNRAEPYTGRTDFPLREEAGAGSEEILALCLGTFSPERGLEKVVQAIGYVKGPVKLVFLGDGPVTPALMSQVTEGGVADRVSFLPPVPQRELPGWLRQADVGLIPYQGTCLNHRLAQPNKLFQFLEAGVPVIAGDLPGLREVIGAGGLGELVPPDDPAAIAAAIDRLAVGEGRKAIVESIKARRESFLWSADEPHLIAAYDRLTRGGPNEDRLRHRPLPA